MGRARRTYCARTVRGVRLGFEGLEAREVPAIGFGTVVGIGASGQFADLRANDEAIDAAGDIVVVGSLMATANFNPGGPAVNVTASGNRDAYVAEYSASGVLKWVVPFAGQTTASVGQASAVAVDASGNVEVAGSFSGSVKIGGTTLSAPSRTDAFVAKLNASGTLLWAVQTTGTTNKVDSASAVAPDGSGGVYVAGSYASSMTVGSTPLTAAGQTEAWAAHFDSSGRFVWAKSTAGSAGSVAGMNGLAVDPSGRLVMAGYFAGSVNFNPGGSTVLAGAGSYDIATWVLNADGSLAWAEGFGGPGYDQADAVAVDTSGNVYVTGAFSGTVNFNPSGTAINLTARGNYDVFVLKLGPTGSTAWADSFVGSNGPAIGNGLGIDPSGHVVVGGWFVGTLDFDPGAGTTSIASRGAEDVFVASLDASGNLVAVTTGGGNGSDMAFGLAINASGTVAVAGVYNGPGTAPPGPTSFGSTNLATIGSVDIFVASLTQSGGGGSSIVAPNPPALEASSDSGSSNSDGLTNVTSPTFDITGAGSTFTVQLLRDGTVVATRVGNGAITDPGVVPDGAHQYTARQVDGSGDTGPASTVTAITVDATPPATPDALALLLADDSGTAGDGITKTTRPRLTGTAEAGSTVRLLVSGSVIGTGTATGGTYTILLNSALADGTYSVTASATDAAGNASTAGSPFSLTIDTTPPAAPTLGLLAADDSGTLGDGLTNVATPRVTGSAEAGATVRLFLAGNLVGTAAASGGTYLIPLTSALADGTYSLTATATDLAGNTGASSAFALTIDATAPAAPAAPRLPVADDSGVPNDGITNVNRPHLAGSAESGSTVTLTIAGAVVGAGTAVGGSYAILLDAALGDGTYVVTASAADAAGNVSPVGGPFTLAIDTTSPAAPPAPGLLPDDDSGAVGDGLTNVTKPRLTGSAESGATVRLFAGGLLVGTGTASGGTYMIAPTSALADGTYAMTATATDAAGNVGAASVAFALTIDATAPAAPAAPRLLAVDDSGTTGDGATNVNAPRITGTAESGATVRLFAGGTLVGTGTAVGGSYTIAVAPALLDGTYAITATAADLAGNTGAAGAPFTLRIDTVAPAVPSVPAVLASDDTGPQGDGITGVVRPHLTGTAEPGATVKLFRGTTLIGTGTAAGGSYTIQINTSLADGTYSITATATDLAGNASPTSAPFSLTIDTTAPSAPSAPSLLAADDSGAVGDGITNVTKPRLTGTAEAGTTVNLFAANKLIGTGTATGGVFTIAITSALADGTYSVVATATNAVGNASGIGPAFSLTIDTAAPAAPSDPSLLAADDSGATGDGVTNVADPRLTGLAEAGSTVTLFIAGNPVGTATATGGTYTILLNAALSEGTYSVVARATDAAGNAGAAGPAFLLTIDTTAPAVPAAPGLLAADDSGTLGDGITSVKAPRLTGSAEAGSTVRFFAGGNLIGTGTATGGTYRIATVTLADGTYNVTATATDAAGNASAASVPFALTIDTTPPSAPPAPGLLAADDSGTLGDGITNDSTPRITGSAEAGATVTLTIAGKVVGTAQATGGTYTIAITSALADGTYSFTASATDLAGNAGPAGPAFRLTIDTVAPAAPSLALVSADDTGVKGDGATAVHVPRVSGSAVPGSLVQLLDAGGNVVGSVQAASDGSYTLATPNKLVGTFAYRVRDLDPAGNLGAASQPLSFRTLAVAGDYDGDGKADPMTYDAATVTWSINLSSTGTTTTLRFGIAGLSVPIPADYDGDGKTDAAIYMPSTGEWYIYNSGSRTITHYVFGRPGDIPVPADYTGIGRAEPAVYRPSTSQWLVFNPVNGAGYVWTFGFANQSLPVPAPYAGYGTADLAIYQPSTGDWYSVNTTTWALSHTVFGGPGFAPAPADYDGDGKADVAVYWPATAQWIIKQSSTGTARVTVSGLPNVDQPVPLDYDGDGHADLATYRPSTSSFVMLMSTTGMTKSVTVGQPGSDEPALVPWTYEYANVLHVAAASIPGAHPAIAIAAAPAASPSTASPASTSTPTAVSAARPSAVPVVIGKTPIPQPIKWKGWLPSAGV